MRFTLRQLMVSIALVALLLGAFGWGMRQEAFRFFFWLGSQAFDAATYFFPGFTWIACGGLVLALIDAATHKRVWRWRSLWLLVPFALPVAILACSVMFRISNAFVDQRVSALSVLFWSHVPVSIILLIAIRKNWLVVLGLSLFQAWISLGSTIMSTMSITNRWL
jgi:hypothetical protein